MKPRLFRWLPAAVLSCGLSLAALTSAHSQTVITATDAGPLPASAMDLSVVLHLTQINGTLSDGVDMFKLTIGDPSRFSATTSTGTGELEYDPFFDEWYSVGTWDTQLYLFNSGGQQVAYNDDYYGLEAHLGGFTGSAGIYYLAITRYFSSPTGNPITGWGAANVSGLAYTLTLSLEPRYWQGGASGLWSGNNWTSDITGGAAQGTLGQNADVVFSASNAQNQNTTLDTNFSIHSLTVNDPAAVTIGGSNTLTINSTVAQAVTVNAGAGKLTISANLALAGSANTITVNNTAGMTISGVVTSDAGLIKDGTGTLTLTGANTYSGGTSLKEGTLVVGNDSALGTGTLTIAAGTTLAAQVPSSSTSRTLSNDLVINGDFNIHPGGTLVSISSFSLAGDVDLTGGNRTITNTSNFFAGDFGEVNFSGQISNGGIRFAAISGSYAFFSLTGSAANLYTGDTFVGTGVSLRLQKSAGVTAIAGNLTIEDDGVAVVDANEQIADTATVTVNGIGRLQLGAFNDVVETIGGLMGDGEVAIGDAVAGSTLRVGSGTFSGSITGGVAGSTSLEKYGTGTLTLTGVNTYEGNTVISGGALQIGNGGTTGSIAGDVTNNASLIFDRSDNVTFAGAISGTGSVTKEGEGTLTLTGSTTYTGGTTVNEGTLRLGNGTDPFTLRGADGVSAGDSGTIAVTVNNGAALELAAQATVAGGNGQAGGAAGGAGARGVVFTAGGILTNAGAINGGSGASSSFGASGTGGSAVDISGAAGSVVNTGSITGGAGGAGQPTSTPGEGGKGVHFQSAGSLINSGSITGGSSSSVPPGGQAGVAVSFDAGGTLTNNGSGTITGGSSSSAGGNGGVGVRGAGVSITTSGAISGGVNGSSVRANAIEFTGGTNRLTLLDGFSITGNVVAGGTADTLELGGADNGTFDPVSGQYQGFETLQKTGTSTWTLTGAHDFTGETNIVEGTLIVNGSITSPTTTVGSAGVLGGSGTIGGALINFGLVSPGNSPATLSVSGNFTQDATGQLKIEIGGRNAGEHDLLAIGGSAQLDGVLQLVRLNNFQLKAGERIVFLTAAGGVNGTFANEQNEFATGTTISGKVVYGAKEVALVTKQEAFVAVPELIEEQFPDLAREFSFLRDLTPNQVAVARALDRLVKNGKLDDLIAFLNGKPLPELPADFDRLAPEELTAIFSTAFSLADVQSLNLQRRTDDLRSGANGFSAAGLAINGQTPSYSGAWNGSTMTGVAGPTGDASKDANPFVAAPQQRWGVFLSGTGQWVDVENDGDIRGYDLESGGFTLGVDYKVTPHFALGISAGYAGTRGDLAENGRVSVNGGKLGLYATYFTGGFYSDFAVTGGYNSYDTKRAALGGAARGSTEGGELNVLVGTGYDWQFGALTIGPTATFQYTYVGLDGFTEHGSRAPLDLPSQNAESLRTALGLRARGTWKCGGVLLKPELRAAWQHELGDDRYALDSSFANAAGNVFTAHGPRLGRDALLLGAGLAAQLTESITAYANYDAQLLRENYQSHSVSAGVKVAF